MHEQAQAYPPLCHYSVLSWNFLKLSHILSCVSQHGPKLNLAFVNVKFYSYFFIAVCF